MKLVYSFTRKLSNSDLEWQMKFYTASIIRAKSIGYFIKMYGCNYAENCLKDVVDEFVNIENEEFILTDDLKIWIHSKEDLDCITIDGDVILNSKLIIPITYDVVFDFCVNIKKLNLQFNKNLEKLNKFNLSDSIRYFNYDGKFSCNVGILKFNNIETKNLLIDNYYNFREYFIQNVLNVSELKDPSTIVCEYYFARILEEEDKPYTFFKNFNNYTHYLGYKKETKEFKDVVLSIKNNTNKSII